MKVKVRATPTKAQRVPQEPKVKKENRLIKFISILRQDLDNFIHRKKDEKWEDYKKYCDLARGRR